MEWFRHDTDARNDIKMRKLSRDHGLTGIGAFWVAVEVLYDHGGTVDEQELRDELDFITPSGMLDILAEYNLVTIENGQVTSARVSKEVEFDSQQRAIKAEAGRMGGLAKASNVKQMLADAKQSLAKSSTIQDNTIKKDISIPEGISISKEKTAATRFVKPTVEEVKAYCSERLNTVDPETFVNFYESKGWKVGNTPMKDWKAAVRTWERAGNRTPQAQRMVRHKMETDKAVRARAVNPDGTLNLLGGTT